MDGASACGSTGLRADQTGTDVKEIADPTERDTVAAGVASLMSYIAFNFRCRIGQSRCEALDAVFARQRCRTPTVLSTCAQPYERRTGDTIPRTGYFSSCCDSREVTAGD